MAKENKNKLGKGLIVVVLLAILTILAGVASVVLLSRNISIVQLFGGIDNVYESARLEKLTINGYRVGDKISDSAKEYQVIDSDFDYYYDEVAFWVKDDNIFGIGFYTFNSGLETSINDAKIIYEKQRLVTLDDFEETFGLGEEKSEQDNKTIIYRQDEYTLTVEAYKGVVQNVILLKNTN